MTVSKSDLSNICFIQRIEDLSQVGGCSRVIKFEKRTRIDNMYLHVVYREQIDRSENLPNTTHSIKNSTAHTHACKQHTLSRTQQTRADTQTGFLIAFPKTDHSWAFGENKRTNKPDKNYPVHRCGPAGWHRHTFVQEQSFLNPLHPPSSPRPSTHTHPTHTLRILYR